MKQLQTKAEKELVQHEFDELLKTCADRLTPEELKLVGEAFRLANEAHMGTKRKSGEPYILHPIAVARIISEEIGLGCKSICAALLHDVVEDTDITLEDIRYVFGDKITYLVDGLTKIEGAFEKNASNQAENFKRILLTLSNDVRVIIIKIADRLHNMRTLSSMPEHKQVKIAGETMYLFAPLAYRLGFFAIKTELEDLSFKYFHPKEYQELKEKVSGEQKANDQFVQEFTAPIIEKLNNDGVRFEINSRFKSLYSIWRKMQSKDIPFEEVYDLFAIRIIFEADPEIPERTQCWHIYSLITEVYKSKTDRIRDWVSTPKANGYEALHCTVMAKTGNWVEIQIRSKRMDEIAERGFAAHWKYKNNDNAQESEIDKWLEQVKELLRHPDANAIEFLDQFQLNLFTSEIYVFTPKGETRTLPKGATALDLAYTIHTEIGNKAIGAKVNHKLVPLNHILQTGDQVEILTASTQRPQREWLDFVHTAKAKSLIKDSIKAEIRDHYKKGKALIEELLQKKGIRPSARTLRKLNEAYGTATKDELYSNVGAGFISLDNFDKVLRKNTPNKWVPYWGMQLLGFGKASPTSAKQIRKVRERVSNDPKEKLPKVNAKAPYIIEEVAENQEPNYRIASCCKPIPGDEVIGFVDNKNVVTIHKKKCPEAVRFASQNGDKIVNAKWATHKVLSFLVVLNISGIDRVGLLNDITNVITGELNVNIRKLSIESHDGIFEGQIELYVHDTADLNNLIMKVAKIKGVDSVKRMENQPAEQKN